ncbi:hypothetical protein DFH06DRAFT_325539 [Mycena polygramma]|nr:hypothetical protein DFH06DRAFT_325539 [Mycena polygramma]
MAEPIQANSQQANLEEYIEQQEPYTSPDKRGEANQTAEADNYGLTCRLFMNADDAPKSPPFPGGSSTQMVPEGPQTRISAHRPSLWPNGSRIRVMLANDDRVSDNVRARVQAYAQSWSAWANIYFDFVTTGPSDIRVAFSPNEGSSSVIGTVARNVPQDQRTMNLDINILNSSLERLRAETLHEFGHALGLIHEHQSPSAQIPWNLPALYAHYAAVGSNRAWVDLNILNDPFPADQIDADPVADRRSIMIYTVDPSLTDGQYSVPWNTDLSIRDCQRIAEIYPRDAYAIGFVTTNASTVEPMEWDSVIIGITPQQPAGPQVASALRMIDSAGSEDRVRVRTTVENVGRDRFTVGIGSWGESTRLFYNGGVSLMRTPPNDPHFRMGTISTRGSLERYSVEFNPPFPSGVIPIVYAAFSGIDSSDNWRGNILIVSQSNTAFDVQISAWGNSNLLNALVQWIAFPSTLPGVEIGTFRGAGGASGMAPLRNAFISTPAVFTGFQRFDVSPNSHFRLRLNASARNATEVEWSIETWGDSEVYEVQGAFLAFTTGGFGSI